MNAVLTPRCNPMAAVPAPTQQQSAMVRMLLDSNFVVVTPDREKERPEPRTESNRAR